MKALHEIREDIRFGRMDEMFHSVYVDAAGIPYQKERYLRALDRFRELYPEMERAAIFSAPGRSEICGNHTDHQNGMVLAASVNVDMIAVVSGTDDTVIDLVSGDSPAVRVDVSDLSVRGEETGTTAALIRGVAAGFAARGYRIGGFRAYVTSDVPVGSGMSSSAAFETLVGTIFSGLYNHEKNASSVEIARIGQAAENRYFGKPCGLMDQMASSVGGLIFIDFKERENPLVRKVACNFDRTGLNLCIVNTKGSHADLTPDYAAIPEEMETVARALGREKLREVPEDEFWAALPELAKRLSGRALLRAMHFFGEEKRVREAAAALESFDTEGFLDVIRRSGDSSARYLQNIYSPKHPESQNLTLALAATERFLAGNGVCHAHTVTGVCRVHGGGFAGTIQVWIRHDAAASYKEEIEKIFGEGSCLVLRVRPFGGMRVV